MAPNALTATHSINSTPTITNLVRYLLEFLFCYYFTALIDQHFQCRVRQMEPAGSWQLTIHLLFSYLFISSYETNLTTHRPLFRLYSALNTCRKYLWTLFKTHHHLYISHRWTDFGLQKGTLAGLSHWLMAGLKTNPVGQSCGIGSLSMHK